MHPELLNNAESPRLCAGLGDGRRTNEGQCEQLAAPPNRSKFYLPPISDHRLGIPRDHAHHVPFRTERAAGRISVPMRFTFDGFHLGSSDDSCKGNTLGAIFNAALSNILGVLLTPLLVRLLMQASGQVGFLVLGVRLSFKPCWHCSHLLRVARNTHVLSGYLESVTRALASHLEELAWVAGQGRPERETKRPAHIAASLFRVG